ncbi:SUKH-4 family immunity protein [Kitasatospora sp. NPDC056138]|uniref:SUKH-4 family immunity protein n=1 Tax=Kitasatospora sp. NPDC056138 TaxID=3345724 RepID=UPI0035DD50AD
MTLPFTPAWARPRPAAGAPAGVWTDWPGPVIAAATAQYEGRTVYGSVSSTVPHRLQVVDAATGRRLAPPLLCSGDQDAFALVATPGRLIAAGTDELVDPLLPARYGYPAEEPPEDIRLLAAVSGSTEVPGPLVVSVQAFDGLRVWDVATGRCVVELPSAERTPGSLTAGIAADRPYAVVSHGGRLCSYQLLSGEESARWTAHADSEILQLAWAEELFPAGRDAVLSADRDSRLRAWDPVTGAPLTPFWQLPDIPLHLSAAALPRTDGALPVISCAYGDGVQLLQADTGRELLNLRLDSQIRTAHLTPDGLLLLGTFGGTAALRLDPELLETGAPHAAELVLAALSAATDRDGAISPDQQGDAADSGPSHADLVRLWGEDQVVLLEADQLEGVPAPTREVLRTIGMPLSPAPGAVIDSDLPADGLAPLLQVGVGPEDPDDPDARYVPGGLEAHSWLGTWHDDDLVLSPEGTVQAVGPDSDYEEALLVNSSLAAFVAFSHRLGLALLQADPECGSEEQEALADRLEARLRAIDPAAFDSGAAGHWAAALSDFASGM